MRMTFMILSNFDNSIYGVGQIDQRHFSYYILQWDKQINKYLQTLLLSACMHSLGALFMICFIYSIHFDLLHTSLHIDQITIVAEQNKLSSQYSSDYINQKLFRCTAVQPLIQQLVQNSSFLLP
jgi:hypothetical protein